MAKKKTKTHQKVGGKLLQMNKRFTNLKMKQRDRITGWVYEEYKKYYLKNEAVPGRSGDEEIVGAVLQKIEDADIWIPEEEIYAYYRHKKAHLQTRLENEKKRKFNGYGSFYRSIIDQDRSAVVICNLQHEIIYMNPAAVASYGKYGGEKLIGKSLLDCHSGESCAKIREVVQWFEKSPEHNLIYTFHNEKQNKDVYMVALREEGRLIGYYEKHEYRNPETMKFYDMD